MAKLKTACVLLFMLCEIMKGVWCNDIKEDRRYNEIEENIPYPTDNTIPTLAAGVQGTQTNIKTDNVATVTTERPKETIQTTTPPPSTTHYHTTPKDTKLDPMDQYVLDGILKIVDAKFDTLNKRIMSLEKGINSLQYYNVRSFRVVNTHLHAVDTILHGMHSEVNQVELQNRGFQQSIAAVKEEVIDLQTMNSGMWQAVEQNLVHFHDDITSRISEVKHETGKCNSFINEVFNETAEIKVALNDMKVSQNDIVRNTEAMTIMASELMQASASIFNITVTNLHTSGNIARNTETIIDSTSSILKNMSSVSTDTEKVRIGLTSFLSNISSDMFEDELFTASGEKEETNYKEMRARDTELHATCSKLFELLDKRLSQINVTQTVTQNTTCKISDSEDFKNDSRTLLNALSVVNENILQSVTLYRHTGSLIERVISDTEIIANEQVRLREEFHEFLFNGSMLLLNRTMAESPDLFDIGQTPEKGHTDKCVTSEAIEEVLKIGKNGTQLVDLLTDLATASTASIKLSVDDLNNEITRLGRLQEEVKGSVMMNLAEAFSKDDPRTDSSAHIRDIHNRTEWIYQLVEAIASNTGWIPYVYHSIRFVESQVNKTLKQTNAVLEKSDELLTRQRFMAFRERYPLPTTKVPKLATTLHKHLKKKAEYAILKPTKPPTASKMPNQSNENRYSTPANHSAVRDHMLEFVYETNVKIDRLIPALTNLLGEPEPYIALVNGKTDREGRVEIYHKGLWGTVCGTLGHVEASYVCRSLGYLGGISAGSGRFGIGSGTFWHLNVTCLRTRWCDAVSPAVDPDLCDHNKDAAVICDHMIRLTPTDDEEASRNMGMVEIFNNNNWSPICAKSWDRNETAVVCRQLGFREGAAFAIKDNSLKDIHWFTNVTCKGTENRIDACANSGIDYNGCQDYKYVSVICS